MYIEGIKYVNLMKIGPVVIEIWGVENDDLVVPVNTNTCVPHVFLGRWHMTMRLDHNIVANVEYINIFLSFIVL